MDRLAEFYKKNAPLKNLVPFRDLRNAREIVVQSGQPWVALDIPVPYAEMLEEAKALHDCFVPHRTTKEQNQGWLSLCIHGLSAGHTGPHYRYYTEDTAPYEWVDPPYQWTDICGFCPVTADYFKNKFGFRRFYRLRFMLLKPGGYILPHNDSCVDELDNINIALNQPEGCDFVMENMGIVPFKQGSAIMLSLSRDHIVWNNSNEDRYHIIVHGERDPEIWDDIILRSYNAAAKSAG
jgi:hypothetical protein